MFAISGQCCIPVHHVTKSAGIHHCAMMIVVLSAVTCNIILALHSSTGNRRKVNVMHKALLTNLLQLRPEKHSRSSELKSTIWNVKRTNEINLEFPVQQSHALTTILIM